MCIGPEMFNEVTDRATALQTFKRTVERIEMETHSYCNRRCTYCPNVVGDRIGPNQRIDPDIWEKLISGLEEIDYDKFLVMNYYNEPLADLAILDRIREARARVPKCRIMIYTNGDYLEPKLIDDLADAGLDYMHVSIHLKRNDKYSDLYILNRINEVSVRMGIPARFLKVRVNEFVLANAPHKKLEIEIRGINFQTHGTDRGGLIPDITTASKRSTPCSFVFSHFVMGFDGSIAPCCHIRSDRPEHADYVYGNLRDFDSIFQAFTSAKAADWRRELGGIQEKRAPCDTCMAGQMQNPADQQVISAAARKFAPVA